MYQIGEHVTGLFDETNSGIRAGIRYQVISHPYGHLFMVSDVAGTRYAARTEIVAPSSLIDISAVGLAELDGSVPWNELDEFVKDDYYKKAIEVFANIERIYERLDLR